MHNGLRRSTLELRGSRKDLRVGSKLHLTRPRAGDSAPFCALNPMAMTKQPGGGAGGAFPGESGG
eukprot:11187583-Alexandrium_andersonii.AAC.1